MARYDLPSRFWRKPLHALAKLITKWRGCKEYILQTDRKCRMKHCGKQVRISNGTILSGLSRMSFGDHVYVGPGCVFYSADADLTIDDYVTFGPRVTIMTGNHRTDVVGEFLVQVTDKGDTPEDYDKAVYIGKDAWIGANSTILKGVTVANGTVIGAGSVVTKDTVPYGVYAGVPARLIKLRFPEEAQKEHDRMLSEKYGCTFD